MALAQAAIVVQKLGAIDPHLDLAVVVVAPRAPENAPYPREPGEHTSALQRALAGGDIDIAVHSYKDLPTRRPEGLVIAAIPLRDDPRDALVSRAGMALRRLAAGAAIGTSSPRREVQLKAIRPDISVIPIRGNVDSRVSRVEDGELDAIVVSLAGLKRLGLQARASEVFSVYELLPAPAQGALAVECRAADASIRAILRAIDDPAARSLVTAERSFLAALGGDCNLPVGAYAERFGSTLKLHGMLAAGGQVYRTKNAGQADAAVGLGRELAAELLRLAGHSR